ncbi:unnamed protein product [Musa banksii]
MLQEYRPESSKYLNFIVLAQFTHRSYIGRKRRMRKASCCPKEGLNRGAWTSEEDKLLSDYILAHGLGRWRSLPANAGLNRCGKSCRLRWLNYLRPDIKKGNITQEEEDLIIRLHNLLGNSRWSLIAGRLPGRTDNEIKNYWNTYLRKKGLHSSPSPASKNREVQTVKAVADKQKGVEVNVIRTKAIRCTRSLFADEVPASGMNNSAYSVLPSAMFDYDTSDFSGNDPAPQAAKSVCSEENMQNSVFPQAADGFYTSSGSFHDSFSATASSSYFNYTKICSTVLEKSEELHPFMCDDEWVSLLMHPNI